MEILLLLGLLALVTLLAMGALYWIRERRAGTIVAVSIPLRSVPSAREERRANSH
jgi:uncharacterized iron-regulated membrane protein